MKCNRKTIPRFVELWSGTIGQGASGNIDEVFPPKIRTLSVRDLTTARIHQYVIDIVLMRGRSGNHFSIFVNRSLSANCSSIFHEVRNRPSVLTHSTVDFSEEPSMNYSYESAFPKRRGKKSQMRFSNFELLQSFSSLSGKLAVPIFSSFVFKAQQKCPKLSKVFADGRSKWKGGEKF